MNRDELLRLIESMHMEKGIQKDLLFESLESALVSAARKRYTDIEELRIKIDRLNGDIRLMDGDRPLRVLEPAEFGRIAAQTAKQVMIQRIREAESDVVYEEFEAKTDTLVNGVIQRIERGNIILNIGKSDAVLPRAEQIPSENYRPGERVRCYVVSVKKKGSKVVILLSRTHPDLVRELFELEVPEIYDHIVEIRGLVREPGYRTKIAVNSSDSRVDAVGACVGIRGSRIRNIVEELNGEKIDIVRWSESEDVYIRNALSPAEIEAIEFDKHHKRARVVVPEDQLSLAIGKKGQNVRLSSRLTGWDLDIMTVDQHRSWREKGRDEIATLPGVGEATVNNLLLTGFECFRDIVELGVEKLTTIKGIGEKKAEEIFNFAVEGHRKRVEEDARAAAEARQQKEDDRKSGASRRKPALTEEPEKSLEDSLTGGGEPKAPEKEVGAKSLEDALFSAGAAEEVQE
jgi:N utilization substance protein A